MPAQGVLDLLVRKEFAGPDRRAGTKKPEALRLRVRIQQGWKDYFRLTVRARLPTSPPVEVPEMK